MTDVTLCGFPQSTYVRAARMTLAEKGVQYWLEPVMPGSEEAARLHPFGRIPAFRHGERPLFETLAIVRYVDEAFDGPSLQPQDAYARAVMTQWLSAIVDSVYPVLIRGYLMPYAMAELQGTKPDRAAIDAAVPRLEPIFAVLDQALASVPYLAGTEPSLADLVLYPKIYYMQNMPESSELLANFHNLTGWSGRLQARPSSAGTVPPPISALR